MTLDVQFITLLMMMGSGILLGTVFDAYRVAAIDFRFPRWTLPIIDALYWAAATIFVFFVLRYSNFAEVRIFIFLGLALGAVIYYAMLSSMVMRLTKTLYRTLKWLYRLIVSMFKILVIKPLVLIYRFLLLILGAGATLTILLLKGMLKLLYPFRFIWNMLMKLFAKMMPVEAAKRLWKRIIGIFKHNDKEE